MKLPPVNGVWYILLRVIVKHWVTSDVPPTFQIPGSKTENSPLNSRCQNRHISQQNNNALLRDNVSFIVGDLTKQGQVRWQTVPHITCGCDSLCSYQESFMSKSLVYLQGFAAFSHKQKCALPLSNPTFNSKEAREDKKRQTSRSHAVALVLGWRFKIYGA